MNKLNNKKNTGIKGLIIDVEYVKELILNNRGIVDNAEVNNNNGKVNAYVLFKNGYLMMQNTLANVVEDNCEQRSIKVPDVWMFEEAEAEEEYSYKDLLKTK